MKKLKIIFYGLFIALFSLGIRVPLMSQAETLETEQTVDVKGCGGEYYAFIATVRNEETRSQTIQDAFTRPYCQLYDIMDLDEELDELKDAFRSAAYSCESLSTYKLRFREILMEQYFIRNFQASPSGVINSKDAEDYGALKQELLARLREKMNQFFVIKESWVTEDSLDEYFSNWSSKYDDRLMDYNNCNEGPWAELTETWTSFVDTLRGLSIDIKKTNVDADEDTDEDMSLLGKGVIAAYKYVKNIGNKKATEIEAPSSITDLSSSDVPFTVQGFLENLSGGDQIYEIEINGTRRMARYEMLYGYGSAVSATDMQGILHELNLVLEESNAKDFPNILSGAAKVYDKQCN